MIGIYKITNLINGHYYIGQSRDIKARFRSHRFSGQHLKDKDHSSPIHLALAKYGAENFSYEILEECSPEELNEKETYWIEKLQATKNGNYNILAGGQDRVSFEGKEVELYDLQGNYLRTVSSATKVAEELNVSRVSVYQVLHGQRPTCKNLQMKYKDSEIIIKPFISRRGGSKKVLQINPSTNEIIQEFLSCAEAARITGADASTIVKVCKGKLKTANGYKWSYAE